MSHHDDVIPDSTYPPLEPPGEFKSQIPEHLVEGASKTDQFIMAQISILRQYNDWSVKALLAQDKNVRLTNGRLRRAEEDIRHLKGDEHSVKVGWKVIGWIGGALVTIITVAAAVYEALHAGG
jgi:hypothetical protein